MKTLALAIAVAVAVTLPAHAAYKCVDEKGKAHIGDTPPAGCANVPMQETSPSGRVLRTIAPTLTEEQARAKSEELAKQKEAEKLAAEQKRKDLALLSTYSTEKEFDVARDRNIEPITGRIKNARDRLDQLDRREKQLLEEMEFYKAGKSKGKDAKASAPPAALVANLEAVKNEKEGVARGISANEREIEQIRARFDVDRKRWLSLKYPNATPAPAKN